MQKFCNKDYQALRTIQGLQVSPDGRRALYTVQRMNVDRDAYESFLWLLDLETGRETQLTGGGRENGAFWLDSLHVVFSAVRGGELPANETVFYRIAVDGGEALEYMRVPVAGARASLLGEDRFLIRADVDLNPEGERDQEKWMFFDEYPYWGDGASYENRHRRALFLWNRAAGELRQLTAPTMQTFMPYCSDDVLTDENGLCFVGYDYTRDAAGKACICRYEWASGETRILCQDSCYVFSLSQREGRVYYGAWAIEDGPAIASIRIKSVSLQGGDVRVDAAPQWELGAVRQREGITLFQRTFRAASVVSRWDGGLRYEDIPTPGVNPTCPIPVGEDVIFTGWHRNRLPEVYRWREGQVTQMSHQNDSLYDTYTFSTPEPLCAVDGSDLRQSGIQLHHQPVVYPLHGGELPDSAADGPHRRPGRHRGCAPVCRVLVSDRPQHCRMDGCRRVASGNASDSPVLSGCAGDTVGGAHGGAVCAVYPVFAGMLHFAQRLQGGGRCPVRHDLLLRVRMGHPGRRHVASGTAFGSWYHGDRADAGAGSLYTVCGLQAPLPRRSLAAGADGGASQKRDGEVVSWRISTGALRH